MKFLKPSRSTHPSTLLKALLGACALSVSLTSVADTITRDVDALLADQQPTFVHVDRCPVDFSVPPVIVNGRTFVEAGALFQQLNINLSWNQSEQRVTGTAANGSQFHLWIGSRNAELNGRAVELDAAPFIGLPHNRTMVPLSFIGQATGAQVNWRASPRTVDIFAGINRTCAMNDLQDLVDFSYRGYLQFNEAGPFSITPIVLTRSNQSAYLVAMSGTDLARVEQTGDATGIYQDLLIGFFNASNAFTRNVVDQIMMQVPPGSRLVLAGHSLGGMVAQQVASSEQIKANYQVLNTVTFGSPLIAAGRREGTVRRVGDTSDAVPLLSLEGTILLPWQVFGLNRRDGGYGPLRTVQAHVQSYRRDSVWAGFDVLGFQNDANGLTFNPANVRFYPAPIR